MGRRIVVAKHDDLVSPQPGRAASNYRQTHDAHARARRQTPNAARRTPRTIARTGNGRRNMLRNAIALVPARGHAEA